MSAIAPDRLGEELVAARVLIPGAARGVYALGAPFAAVADAVARALRVLLGEGIEQLRFPAVMARGDLERIGYYRDFPHLLGCVHSFCGDEAAHRDQVRRHDAGEDWGAGQAMSDLVLVPAACYPLYPLIAARGPLPEGGHRAQVEATCFRREPSDDPVRLQSFAMQEIVQIGTPAQALAFRDQWLEQGQVLLAGWGLDGVVEAADDPFFGRAAVVLAKSQRAQELKFELKLPVTDADRLTACMSANYHLDKFGRVFDLRTADGEVAHSACVGFGIERVTLALFREHGIDTAAWLDRIVP